MTAPFSRIVRIHEVPPLGLHVPVVATDEERAAIAAELGLAALDALTATILVRPVRRGFRVEGKLRAQLAQACVVTLEPVPGTVAEEIEVLFAPPDAKPRPTEIDLDAEEEDPPEPLEGNEIDLAPLLMEHLVLGLDPYPRAPGAVFEAPSEEAAEPPRRSPFADLEKLRKR